MMKLTLVLLLAAHAYRCDNNHVSSHRVNGVATRPYSWPWQVSLQYFSRGIYHHICGGTLIAPNWVLTAAHCIWSPTGTYRVVLGEYDLTGQGGYEHTMSVEKTIVHVNWQSNCVGCGNDIALIKLSRDARVNDRFQPSSLPESKMDVGDNPQCYITGWGRLYSAGRILSQLQQTVIPVFDHIACGRWWGSSVRSSMVCAGGDILSGCNGDYGGPLNCVGRDGKWYVQGVATFLPSGGCNTIPTVFTRTSFFTGWITHTMRNN